MNRKDGSVKLAIYGTQDDIRQAEQWLKAGGPFGARIEHYFAENGKPEVVADFTIRH